jgi:hypothetical protein
MHNYWQWLSWQLQMQFVKKQLRTVVFEHALSKRSTLRAAPSRNGTSVRSLLEPRTFAAISVCRKSSTSLNKRQTEARQDARRTLCLDDDCCFALLVDFANMQA